MGPIREDGKWPGWSGVMRRGLTDRHTGGDQPDRRQCFAAEGRL